MLSRSNVSKVTEILWGEYERFINRELTGYNIVYLVIDAIYESIKRYVKGNKSILVAYGITKEGKKVLLHMELRNKKSYKFCKGFLRDMIRGRLNTPLSITTDGCPGLIKTVDEIFPVSLRIRCWVHKMRNLSSKVPREIWHKMKAELEAIKNSINYQEGEKKFNECVEKYKKNYPSFVKSLEEDREALLNIL
ncbi:MAG TPA: transposase [Candidatus Ratteibacteria bacterium]|nr:transposase [Candidatus Ratteibacteria bacterium]HRV04568.1 transposase [Candidatus Ratteibacteria bacterium]